jgi:hypothetical protein
MQDRNIRYRGGMATLAAGLALAATLAACGGGNTTAASSTTTVAPGSGSAPASRGGALPGTTGSVASLSTSSMEVQNQQTGQVTVNWTPSTTFTRSATLTASSVAAGECVVVTGTTANGTITARTVSVAQPSASGTCTAARPQGAGFGGGGRGAGTTTPGGTRPAPRAGTPTSFATGKVDSVSNSALVITGTAASVRFGGGSTTTTAPSTSITIALNSTTTFTEIESAGASNLAVGDCVTANGSTDSTGAVTATSVRISSTGGQTCTAGFGGFRGSTTSG